MSCHPDDEYLWEPDISENGRYKLNRSRTGIQYTERAHRAQFAVSPNILFALTLTQLIRRAPEMEEDLRALFSFEEDQAQ